MEGRKVKIIQLNSENFKFIKAVEIKPDANFQIISGRNEQGKSSVLDSIWAAIEGRTALKDTDKPIRNGEEKAFITVDLGELIVTRKFTTNGTTLEVKTKDGAKYSSPQKILDALVGKLSFDPLQFSYMDAKDQVKTLQELIGFDPSELDNKYAEIFEQRTEVNREVKTLSGQLEGMEEPTKDIPDEEESAGSILAELRQAQEVQKANDLKREEYKQIKSEYQNTKDEIGNIQREILNLKVRLEESESGLKVIESQGKALGEQARDLVDPDLDSYQERLEKVEHVNSQVRKKKEYTSKLSNFSEKKAISDELTQKLGAINEQKQDMLKAAKFPIEGLSFGESGVEYKDVPFKQCSAAQRLKVAMSVAMAKNPKLKVIRIMDGSLLDSENLKLIQEMAKDQDYQVWVELVDESGEMGVVIEDGQIKNLDKGAK